MAQLNVQSAALMHPVVLGNCRFEPFGNDQIRFVCDGIATRGTVTLQGSGGENVTGWKLGFIQLQFVETNYARYRGRAVTDGSAKVTRSHSRLCRDSRFTARSNLWYEPKPYSPADVQGMFYAAALPASGNITMASAINDAPKQAVDIKIRNRNADNFLHHADIAFHFCTMMVAEDPHHNFTFLKHFYWNVRWEAHFAPDAAGRPQLVHRDHFALNVQRQVHSGIPNDLRFKNQVLSHDLPFSNTVARTLAPHIQLSNDWSLA